MDNHDLYFPSEQVLSSLDMNNEQSSSSFDIEEFLERTQSCNDNLGWTEACTDVLGPTQACTHAHACNQSGPDKSHTHTCIHVHTQIMPTSTEGQDPSDDNYESVDKNGKKRPMGNREAVRKYREKKKARAATLEDEVVRLRALNQHLMKRLQNQGVLEAEIARMKCLLVDIRGRIEGEIGSFPYQKPVKSGERYQNVVNSYQKPVKSGERYQNVVNSNVQGTYATNPCNIQCNDQLYCPNPGSETALNEQGFSDCGFDNLNCLWDQNAVTKELHKLDNVTGVPTGNTSKSSKRKGARATMAS